MRLIIATKNQGKVREIRELFKDLNLDIVSLADLGNNTEVVEDGATFRDNARKKAITISEQYPQDYVVGEDSGLEVDYLDNRPGVHSKRYAGVAGNDLANNQKLLNALAGVKGPERRARFCCLIALAHNGGIINFFEGVLEGRIYHKMAGNNGFGYDSVFYLPARDKTTAQISTQEKNKISHRAKAFNRLKKFLAKTLEIK
jgi:XTP/dITP diphosphohydrolase